MTWCPAVCPESGQREGEGLAEEGGGGGLPALRRVGLPERREGAACLAAAGARAVCADGQGMGAGGCGRTNGELRLEFRNK